MSKIIFAHDVHRSNVCRAKQKLSAQLFHHLLKVTTHKLHSKSKWKGHIVRAVDGTSLTVPNTKDICAQFPLRHQHDYYPRAVAVCAVNVLTQAPEFVEIGDFRTSENAVTEKMLGLFSKGDIALLDRGIGGKALWLKFIDSKQYFLGRLKGGHGKSLYRKFVDSKKRERIVYIRFADNVIRPLRLIRVKKSDRQNPIVLITNLISKRKYTREDLSQLYKQRWQVETCFFRMKQRLHVMCWHSKSAHGILIEILANLLALAVLAKESYLARLKFKTHRREMTVQNFNGVILLARSMLLSALSVVDFRHQLLRYQCLKQPGRSYPRYSKQPLNRWIRQRKNAWQKRRCGNL